MGTDLPENVKSFGIGVYEVGTPKPFITLAETMRFLATVVHFT